MESETEWPGRLGWDLCVLLRVCYQPCTLYMQAQQSKWVGYQGTLDYLGADFTASATLANPDPLSISGVAVLQYLQTLAPRYTLSSPPASVV